MTYQVKKYAIQVELPVDDSEAPDLADRQANRISASMKREFDRRCVELIEKQQRTAEALRKQYEYELSRLEYELSKSTRYDYRNSYENWYEGVRYRTFLY